MRLNHPDVFNILLQILDDGRLTDNQGRTVDFKNTVIIMTSNIGSNYLIEGIRPNGTIDEKAKDKVMDEMRRLFRPEFLNRIDEIVMFKPLQKEEIFKIIDIQLEDIKSRLEDRMIDIELTDQAKEFILNSSYSIQYGARPVKRFLQRSIETEVSRMIIRGDLKDKDTIVVEVEGEELNIRIK